VRKEVPGEMPYRDPAQHVRATTERILRRRAEWFAANGPCVDCGSWEALQVDHVDPATKVEHRIWSWSRDKREAELEKCVPRCQPCHARKSATECAVGEANGATRLTVADVLMIRASAEPVRKLAARLGVGQNTVWEARTGKTWHHLQGDGTK
jgi:hypothetical protein